MADAFYTPHYDVADTWVEPVRLLGTKLDVVPTAGGHPPVIHVHTGNTQFLDTNHNIEITESVGEDQMQGQIEPSISSISSISPRKGQIEPLGRGLSALEFSPSFPGNHLNTISYSGGAVTWQPELGILCISSCTDPNPADLLTKPIQITACVADINPSYNFAPSHTMHKTAARLRGGAPPEDTWDARKFPMCPPHDGTKGIKFRPWTNRFLAALSTVNFSTDPLETFDLVETILGIDEGGAAIPPGHVAPIPLPGGAAAARRRATRLKKAYAYIYQYVDCYPLQLRFVSEAPNNGYAAWNILLGECDVPITDLELEDLKRNVRELGILSTVGYNEYSINMFRRALTEANSLIPTPNLRIGESELCLIMLRAIGTASPVLGTISDIELKATPANRQFTHPAGHPQAGQRSLEAIVQHFEPLWKSSMQRGAIPVRAPTMPSNGTNYPTSLDGFAAGIAGARTNGSLHRPQDTINEPICFNCLGAGHMRGECPSPTKPRSYSAMISLLTEKMNGQSETPQSAQSVTTIPVLSMTTVPPALPEATVHTPNSEQRLQWIDGEYYGDEEIDCG